MNRRIDNGALVTGLVLIGVGTIFLFDRLGVADLHYIIRRFWPMIFVVIGSANLLNRHLWPGLWFITFGAWMQIAHLRLFGVTFASSWPLLLIVFGAGIIARALMENVRRHGA
jgi:hypothetical protein